MIDLSFSFFSVSLAGLLSVLFCALYYFVAAADDPADHFDISFLMKYEIFFALSILTPTFALSFEPLTRAPIPRSV